MDNKKDNLFIVILTYKVSLEKIDSFRAAHLDFLEECYDKNLFLTSGPKVPRNGGVIIAQCGSKNILQKVLLNDPFALNDLAIYEIIEFSPTKWSQLIKN